MEHWQRGLCSISFSKRHRQRLSALRRQCCSTLFRRLPCLRFSVTLPLGINGDARHANTSRYVQLQCGRTPGRYRNSRRISGVLRASRGEASGPRGSANRNYNAPFTAPFCGIRPRPKFQPKARPSAARKPQSVFAPEERAQPKTQPSSPPRVSLTAAPLSLRRVFARLARFNHFG